MYYSAVSARYLEGYRLHVDFADGKSGVVDFFRYIAKGGVFSKLKDLEFFKKFTINPDFGVISWEGEIDIAPETIYSLATQAPLPRWQKTSAPDDSVP